MECDRMVECHYIDANNKLTIQHDSVHFRDRFSTRCKLHLRSHFVPSRTHPHSLISQYSFFECYVLTSHCTYSFILINEKNLGIAATFNPGTLKLRSILLVLSLSLSVVIIIILALIYRHTQLLFFSLYRSCKEGC